ncbi:hypothetical protein [Nocardia sp. CA-290969]|uniref:hypothetical protein n=1 Tax=Nocardia sp. CA-290969 TaxID=3239986 RepID=UPI003D9222DF
MKLHGILLDDDEQVDGATVTLTRAELQIIAVLIGRRSDTKIEEVLPGHGHAADELYNGLIGGIFNRFWEDGLDDALRDTNR